jgi:hypothetical protein
VDRRPSGDHACQGRLLGALDADGRLLKGRSLTGLTSPPLLLLPILALHLPRPNPSRRSWHSPPPSRTSRPSS